MKKRMVVAALVIVVLLWAGGLIWYHQNTLSATDDPAKYPAYLQRLDYPHNESIAFFPAVLPDSVQDFWLSYTPGGLQGGTSLHLSFRTDDVQAYTAQAQAKWFGSVGDARIHAPELLRVLRELPDDATVYLLYSQPYLEGSWNHGETRVIVISGSRVMFQYDRW